MAAAVQIVLEADESQADAKMEKFFDDQIAATKQLKSSIDSINRSLTDNANRSEQAAKKNVTSIRQMADEQTRAANAGKQLGGALRDVVMQTSNYGNIAATAFSAGPLVALGVLVLTQTDRIRDMAQALGGFNEKMREMDRLNREANVRTFVGLGIPSVVEQNARINALEKEKEQVKEIEERRIGGAMDQMDFIERTTTALIKRLGIEKQITNEVDLRNQALKEAAEQAEQEAERAKNGGVPAGAFPYLDYKLDRARNQSRVEMQSQINQVGKTGFVLLAQQEHDEIARLRASDIGDVQMAAEREQQIHQLYGAKRVEAFQQMQALIRGSVAVSQDVIEKSDKKTADHIDQLLQQQLRSEQEANDQKLMLLGAQADAEAQLQADRRRLVGDTIGAIEVEEKHRIDMAILGLQSLGLKEKDLAQYRSTLEADANVRIADEHQRLVERMAQQMESVFDDITSGNIGQRIIKEFKRIAFQILADWILAMRGVKQATGEALTMGGGGSSILGTLGSLVFGRGGGGGTASVGGSGIPGVVPWAGGSVPGVGGVFSGGGGATASMGLPWLGGGVSAPAATAAGSMMSTYDLPVSAYSNPGLPSVLGGVTRANITGAATSGVSKAGLFSSLLMLGGAGLGQKFGGTAGMLGAGLAGTLAAGFLGYGPLAHSGIYSVMMGGTSTLGVALGAGAGALLGFGVGTQHGKAAGGISGAGTGALFGALFGGPIGAIIGGLAGLFGGIFGGIFGGSKRRKQAEAFAKEQISEISKIKEAFASFQLDSKSALDQLEQMRASSWVELQQLKGEGKDVFRKKLSPEIDSVEQYIRGTQGERDRRASLFFGPPEFATGGLIGGSRIAGWRMGNGAVLMIGHEGERVMNRQASQQYGSLLDDINAGRSVSTSGMGNITLHLSTLDGPSTEHWLKRGGAKQIYSALHRGRVEGGF